jgi:hypothetical protein
MSDEAQFQLWTIVSIVVLLALFGLAAYRSPRIEWGTPAAAQRAHEAHSFGCWRFCD